MTLSGSKLYAVVSRDFVGISHADCNAFILSQESAQLTKSGGVADQMLAPSMPEKVNSVWQYDLSFFPPSIPSAPYIGWISVIDTLSHYVFTRSIRSKEAANIASFLEELMFTYGPPDMLQSDAAAENRSASVRLVAERFGVKRMRFMRAKEQGIVERSFGTLKAMLRRAVQEVQGRGEAVNIVALLQSVTKSYCIAPHSTLQSISPFAVFFGRPPPRITGALLLQTAEPDEETRPAGRGLTRVGGRTQRDGTSVSRSSVGRRMAAEIGGLADNRSIGASTVGSRQRRPSAVLGLGSQYEPFALRGPPKQRLESTMSGLDAAKHRLGISSTGVSRSFLPATGSNYPSASSSAAGPTSSLIAHKVLAIAWDSVPAQLLYLVEWEGASRDAPSWVYSSTLGGSDATVQAWIKRTSAGKAPHVFEKEFRGPADLDRAFPIPLATVLAEVEDASDHQTPGGADVEGEEGDDGIGVVVSGAAHSAGGRRATVSRRTAGLAVDDSNGMDLLRKAEQTAVAAVRAAQDVVSAARHERVASALRGLRQELNSDDEGGTSRPVAGSKPAGKKR